MFQVFTDFASWLTYTVLLLSPETKLGDAVHFFIEDVSKIFVLLVVMIYIIALLRASLNVERVRDFLAGKNRGIGYLMGSGFGAITPFCSCSSIPIFCKRSINPTLTLARQLIRPPSYMAALA